MSAAHTAQIFHFPRRVQPMGLDLSRAVPADTAAIEAHRVRLDARTAAAGRAARMDQVADLLLVLENNPLSPCLAYPSRDVGGHPYVAVVAAGAAFRLRPDDCRTAADALVGEQAFVGCVQAARDLREAANVAEQRCNAPVLAIASPRPGVTGRATTLILAALIAVAAGASTLFGR